MKLKDLAVIAALGLALNLAFSTYATAGLKLTLDDGTNSIVIEDGDSNDGASNTGEIVFFGSLGIWTFNLGGGISDSPSGISSLHLDSFNRSSGAGTLTVTLEDDTFTSVLSGSSAVSGISVATGGTVGLLSYVDGVEIANLGPLSGFQAADTSFDVSTGSLYSMVMVATITHLGSGTTSLDSSVSVPTPGTLALLGIGLLGFGISSRKKRSL